MTRQHAPQWSHHDGIELTPDDQVRSVGGQREPSSFRGHPVRPGAVETAAHRRPHSTVHRRRSCTPPRRYTGQWLATAAEQTLVDPRRRHGSPAPRRVSPTARRLRTWSEGVQDRFVTTDLNTLLTGLYVKIDEYLGRPARIGRPPRLTDAELLTLAVAQVLLGVRSEARWLLAQPGDQSTPHPIPDRLRPLIEFGLTRLGVMLGLPAAACGWWEGRRGRPSHHPRGGHGLG
jgi:hypothetical protein